MSTNLTAPVRPKRRLANVPSAQLSLADEVATYEINALPDEVARYLSAVETFRAAGSAPTWRPEGPKWYVARGRMGVHRGH